MRATAKLGVILLVLTAACAWSQVLTGPKGPSVSILPTPVTSVTAGAPGKVSLRFRVVRGFHINSNTPRSEFLIPTVLKLDAPTDIVVGKITYPPGQDMSFPFAPDERLSVFSGDFTVGVTVRPLAHVIPQKYVFRGQLKYQACDNAACYPPKQLPVQFEIKVAKAATHRRANPAQSPHAHK